MWLCLMHPVRQCRYECDCALADLLLVLLPVCGRLPHDLQAPSRRRFRLTLQGGCLVGMWVTNRERHRRFIDAGKLGRA